MQARATARRSAGFTLMELMLSMSLFSVLGVALISLLSTSSNMLRDGASNVETMSPFSSLVRTSSRCKSWVMGWNRPADSRPASRSRRNSTS